MTPPPSAVVVDRLGRRSGCLTVKKRVCITHKAEYNLFDGSARLVQRFGRDLLDGGFEVAYGDLSQHASQTRPGWARPARCRTTGGYDLNASSSTARRFGTPRSTRASSCGDEFHLAETVDEDQPGRSPTHLATGRKGYVISTSGSPQNTQAAQKEGKRSFRPVRRDVLAFPKRLGLFRGNTCGGGYRRLRPHLIRNNEAVCDGRWIPL